MVVDLRQLCSSNREWNHVGRHHDFSRGKRSTVKHHTHASSCSSRMHFLFCAREIIKTVDKNKILSSQVSLTNHNKNSWEGLAVRQIRLGIALYLTQALRCVMGVHLSLSNSPPLCPSPTCIHLGKQKVCTNTARYLYSQHNVCLAGLNTGSTMQYNLRLQTGW